ncbi:MAG TPA: hypothetical protein VF378_09695 [Geothrix sp.]
MVLPHALVCLLLGSPLVAQTPIAQDGALALRQRWLAEVVDPDRVPQTAPVAWEAGTFMSLRRQSDWMPLIDGEGLGSALQGAGFTGAGGWSGNGWTLQGRFLAFKERETGASRVRMQEFEATKTTRSGWRFGLEEGPMAWGYGMAGGYLMGSSHLPFMRAVMETPECALSVFGVPLGRWKMETFLGRLEWERQIPEWISDPKDVASSLATQGDRRRPDISGMRFKARFGDLVDMNIGAVSRWGGVRSDGSRVMSGASGSDYLLAYFGAENLVVAEATGNAQDPDPAKRYQSNPNYKNLSNAVADVEFRLRLPALAQATGANGVAVYLSRGASNVNWQWKDFLRHPQSAISHDLSFYWSQLSKPGARLLHSDPNSFWGWGYSEAAPSLTHINDTIGVQWVYDTWDLGAEIEDTRNQVYPDSTFRTYGNSAYLSGHSRYGDSLGQAFGGELYRQSLSWTWRPMKGQELRVLLSDCIRVLRDMPQVGVPPGDDDHFTALQLDFQQRWGLYRLGGSLAVEDHQAWQYVAGQRHHNAILTLGWSRSF